MVAHATVSAHEYHKQAAVSAVDDTTDEPSGLKNHVRKHQNIDLHESGTTAKPESAITFTEKSTLRPGHEQAELCSSILTGKSTLSLQVFHKFTRNAREQNVLTSMLPKQMTIKC